MLECCLIEVGKIQYKFYTLEECVLSSASDEKCSSFDLVNDTEIINIVKLFFTKETHLLWDWTLYEGCLPAFHSRNYVHQRLSKKNYFKYQKIPECYSKEQTKLKIKKQRIRRN